MAWPSRPSSMPAARVVEPALDAMQRRLTSALEELDMVKAERDSAVARADRPNVSAELRALRSVALAVERRLCGVGSADEERKALASWRETL